MTHKKEQSLDLMHDDKVVLQINVVGEPRMVKALMDVVQGEIKIAMQLNEYLALVAREDK